MPFTLPSAPELLTYEIANEMWQKTKGLRDIYLKDWTDFLSPKQVLRPGATPNRTPIYGGGSPGMGGAPTPGQMFVDPLTGQVYGGEAVQYNPGRGAIDLWPAGAQFANQPFMGNLYKAAQQPAVDPYYYTTVGATGPVYGAEGMTAGNSGTQVRLNPFAATGTGAGGTGQTITGYNESYGPEDYITERFNPASLPGYTQNYDVARRGLESQYNTSLAQLIAGTPRGGAMNDAMSRLALTRAETIGGLPAQIASPLIQDVLNKSYQTSFGTAPSTATQAAGVSAQSFDSRYNAELQAETAQKAAESQKGSGLGALGLGFGKVLGSAIGSGGGIGAKMSDKRTKENIKAITELNPVFFDYKPEFGGKDQMGLIADELEEIAPGMVAKGPDGYRRIDVMGIVTMLIKAVQEQQQQIEALAGGRSNGN